MKYLILFLLILPSTLALTIEPNVGFLASNTNYTFNVSTIVPNITINNESLITTRNYTIISTKALQVNIINLVDPYNLLERNNREQITGLTGKQDVTLPYPYYYLDSITTLETNTFISTGKEEKEVITTAFKKKKTNYFFYIIIITLVSPFIFFFIIKRRRKKKKEKEIDSLEYTN